MKTILALLPTLFLFSVSSYSAEVFDSEEKEMLARVSDAYSQCSAYYEIAKSLFDKENKIRERKKAEKLKSESDNMAKLIAERLFLAEQINKNKAKVAAKNLAYSNYSAAIDNLSKLSKSDVNKFSNKLLSYRKGCEAAINNPEKFSENIFKNIQSSNAKKQKGNVLTGPINIDSKKLVEHLNNKKADTK